MPYNFAAMHPVIIIRTVRSLWTDTIAQIPRSTERISSISNNSVRDQPIFIITGIVSLRIYLQLHCCYVVT